MARNAHVLAVLDKTAAKAIMADFTAKHPADGAALMDALAVAGLDRLAAWR